MPYCVVDEQRDNWRAELSILASNIVQEVPTATEAAVRINSTVFKLLQVCYSTERRAPNQNVSESMRLARRRARDFPSSWSAPVALLAFPHALWEPRCGPRGRATTLGSKCGWMEPGISLGPRSKTLQGLIGDSLQGRLRAPSRSPSCMRCTHVSPLSCWERRIESFTLHPFTSGASYALGTVMRPVGYDQNEIISFLVPAIVLC